MSATCSHKASLSIVRTPAIGEKQFMQCSPCYCITHRGCNACVQFSLDRPGTAMAAKYFPFPEQGSWFSTNTPSIKDGMSAESEVFRLWEACFLQCEFLGKIKIKGGIPACARIATTSHTLMRRFYVVNSLRKNNQLAVAAACLLVALKLHNSPNPIQYVANVFASVCYERINGPLKTREIIQCFKHLKGRGVDKTWFHAAWKKLVDDMVTSMRVAERKVLCSTGFQNLSDLAWEWDVLAKLERQLQLHREPKWMAPSCRDEISIDPLNTKKCFEPPSKQINLTGRQLAQHFLVNSARLSTAHCRFTATVIALAAIKNACDAKGIKVQKNGHSGGARPFGLDVVGMQHDRSLAPEDISEQQISACIICVVRARDDLEKLLMTLKNDGSRDGAVAAPGNSAKRQPGVHTPDAKTNTALPGPPTSPQLIGGQKRERPDLEEVEEGECVAWGDEDVGGPAAKKLREDMWEPPAIDQPDDTWRPQAPPPPPSHHVSPQTNEPSAAGASGIADGADAQGGSAEAKQNQTDLPESQGQEKPSRSGDESLEEGEVRE